MFPIYSKPCFNKAATLLPQRGTLAHAAEHGDLAKVRDCLDRGVPVDEVGSSGFTALIYAAMEGHLEIARELIKRGAKLDYEYGYTALMWAVTGGHKPVALLLIESGASLDQPSNQGFTALMVAITSHEKELAEILVHKGADLDRVTQRHNTAIALTIEMDQIDTLRLLLEKGVSLDIRNVDGHTPYESTLLHHQHLNPIILEEMQKRERFAREKADAEISAYQKAISPALQRDMMAPKKLVFGRK